MASCGGVTIEQLKSYVHNQNTPSGNSPPANPPGITGDPFPVYVGGTAIGVSMSSIAAAGGVVGLGIYGLAKMFSQQKSYNQAMMNLEILAEISLEQRFKDLDVEE